MKRPLNQDPVEALYLATASKRLKTEVGCDIEEKSCFTFFGTVGREVPLFIIAMSRHDGNV